MSWICDDCGTRFRTANEDHECPAIQPFTIAGEVPNGGPGPDKAPAVSKPLPVPSALRHAMALVLSATGVREGHESSIDPRAFHAAIRVYRPKDKFEHVGKSCNITRLDERDYACRAAERLLNQAYGTVMKLPGRRSVDRELAVRLEALFGNVKRLAAEAGVDPFDTEAQP